MHDCLKALQCFSCCDSGTARRVWHAVWHAVEAHVCCSLGKQPGLGGAELPAICILVVVCRLQHVI